MADFIPARQAMAFDDATPSGAAAALPSYSLAEISSHSTKESCWVVVHGSVIDVTSFLDLHPGGAPALCKIGRAGRDVTSHFERIGHSAAARAKLKTMVVGRLAIEDVERAVPAARSPKAGLEEHAINWHGARRAAILEKHPEVEALLGHNPWTPLLGVGTVVAHSYLCLLIGWQELSGGAVFCLAYTCGAFLKMAQFALCHDICHGTAGSLVTGHWAKQALIHLCTLPSFGGETQHYYAYQHIGHHAALGTLPLSKRLDVETGELKPPEVLSLEDLDGDLPSPATLLLLAFSTPSLKQHFDERKVQLRAERAQLNEMRRAWRRRKQQQQGGNGRGASALLSDDGAVQAAGLQAVPVPEEGPQAVRAEEVQVTATEEVAVGKKVEDPSETQPPAAPPLLLEGGKMPPWWLGTRLSLEEALADPYSWQFRVLMHPFWVLTHFFSLTVSQLFAGLMINPLTVCCLGCSFSKWGRRRYVSTAKALMPPDKAARFAEAISDEALEATAKATDFDAWPLMLAGIGFGLHTWLWSSVLVVLGSYGGMGWGGLVYLLLSELFLHGFLLHPYAGFFLGVHRSELGAGSSEERLACQPTMSTYSTLWAILSLNLTYHVEHHDFPNVPWSRLPSVHRVAPEFYSGLYKSPGFLTTIYRWLRSEAEWTYACVPPGLVGGATPTPTAHEPASPGINATRQGSITCETSRALLSAEPEMGRAAQGVLDGSDAAI